MSYETIEEIRPAKRNPHIEEIQEVDKFNPYHDGWGRFAPANASGITSFSANPQTKAGRLAIQRAHEAGQGKLMNVHRNVRDANGGKGETVSTSYGRLNITTPAAKPSTKKPAAKPEQPDDKQKVSTKARDYGDVESGSKTRDEIYGEVRDTKWENSLSKEEYSAVQFYQFSSTPFNSYLRAGIEPNKKSLEMDFRDIKGDIEDGRDYVDSDKMHLIDDWEIPRNITDSKSWVDSQIKSLDAAIEKSTIPEDTVLYRGMGSFSQMGVTGDPRDLIGSTITDKGYMSTTIDSGLANQYMQNAAHSGIDTSGGQVSLKITAKAGSKGAFISGFATDAQLYWGGNYEYVLPRNSQIKITGVKQSGNGWEVEAVYE